MFKFYYFVELYDVRMIHNFQNFELSGQKLFLKIFWCLSAVYNFHRHPFLEFFAVSTLDFGIRPLANGRADAVAEFLEVDFIIGARKLLDGSAHVREKLEHTCRLVGGILLLTNAQNVPFRQSLSHSFQFIDLLLTNLLSPSITMIDGVI